MRLSMFCQVNGGRLYFDAEGAKLMLPRPFERQKTEAGFCGGAPAIWNLARVLHGRGALPPLPGVLPAPAREAPTRRRRRPRLSSQPTDTTSPASSSRAHQDALPAPGVACAATMAATRPARL